jgi:hypothetical protein
MYQESPDQLLSLLKSNFIFSLLMLADWVLKFSLAGQPALSPCCSPVMRISAAFGRVSIADYIIATCYSRYC